MRLNPLTHDGPERRRYGYWQRVADQEFYSMDPDAQAQWRELR